MVIECTENDKIFQVQENNTKPTTAKPTQSDSFSQISTCETSKNFNAQKQETSLRIPKWCATQHFDRAHHRALFHPKEALTHQVLVTYVGKNT